MAVDCETSGLFVDDGARLSVVSVAWFEDGGRIRSAAWPFDQGIRDKVDMGTLLFEDDPNLPEAEWWALLDWLKAQRLVNQNLKFDLHHLRTGTRAWPGDDLVDSAYWCTMVASKMLWPTEPTSLKPTSERLGLTGGDERAEEQKLKAALESANKRHRQGKRYDLLDWSEIREYAVKDAELALRLWAYQLALFDEGVASHKAMEFKMDVMRALFRIECRGIDFDVETCRGEADKLRRRLAEVKKGLPFKPTVNGAKEYFFGPKNKGGLGLMPLKATPTGLPQLDDEVQRRLVEQGVPWAEEYSMMRDLEVALSMWYDGYPDKVGLDGRLRTSFRQTEVKSGRMSVERIQLQAIPKEDKTLKGIVGIKSMFRPKRGHRLWNLDLSQAELRVATKYAGCVRMARLLAAGADLHGITTSEIFRVQPDHPEWSVKRDIAKRLTFGGIFQIGPKTFQATLSRLADIRLPLEECEQMVWRWRKLYPEFGTAYRRAEKAAASRGWVRLMPGTKYEERSYFGPRDWPNTAWNRIVQGSLALFNQIWLVETERIAPGLVVLNVHDSQVLEIPERVEDDPVTERVASRVAEHGAREASRLFRTAMKVDYGEWGVKGSGGTAGVDVWEG